MRARNDQTLSYPAQLCQWPVSYPADVGLGVYQDESNWLLLGVNKHQAETGDIIVFSRLNDQLQVVSRVPRKGNPAGKLRIRREDALFRFLLTLGAGGKNSARHRHFPVLDT